MACEQLRQQLSVLEQRLNALMLDGNVPDNVINNVRIGVNDMRARVHRACMEQNRHFQPFFAPNQNQNQNNNANFQPLEDDQPLEFAFRSCKKRVSRCPKKRSSSSKKRSACKKRRSTKRRSSCKRRSAKKCRSVKRRSVKRRSVKRRSVKRRSVKRNITPK